MNLLEMYIRLKKYRNANGTLTLVEYISIHYEIFISPIINILRYLH